MAFATTAPEGSVTCPRKVPVVVDDCAGDWACDWADAGAASPIRVAGIRIAKVRFTKTKTDIRFNTHLILSRQIALLGNAD